MRDVRLRLQPKRQPLHFLSSHVLEVFLFHIFTRGVTAVPLPQVYDVWEERAVKDGLQALRKRQRIDIEMGGGRHEVKVGGCRRQRLGGAGSCLLDVAQRQHASTCTQRLVFGGQRGRGEEPRAAVTLPPLLLLSTHAVLVPTSVTNRGKCEGGNKRTRERMKLPAIGCRGRGVTAGPREAFNSERLLKNVPNP